MKIQNVDVTNPELYALECLATSWILCKKHNAQTMNKGDVEIYKIQHSCKACISLVKQASNRALHLWSKLIHEYTIARYGYCCDDKTKNSKAKTKEFDVIIEQDEDGAYVAHVPELPGCLSQGNTIKEITKNITEAIELYLECTKNVKIEDALKFIAVKKINVLEPK